MHTCAPVQGKAASDGIVMPAVWKSLSRKWLQLLMSASGRLCTLKGKLSGFRHAAFYVQVHGKRSALLLPSRGGADKLTQGFTSSVLIDDHLFILHGGLFAFQSFSPFPATYRLRREGASKLGLLLWWWSQVWQGVNFGLGAK